jgi:hypothetical protein
LVATGGLFNGARQRDREYRRLSGVIQSVWEAVMKITQAEAAEYIGELASELASLARKHQLHHIAYCLQLTVADAMSVAGNSPVPRRPADALH